MPTDYKAGKTHILYSTAEIATWTVVDGKDVVLFYLKEGQAGEIAVSGVAGGDVTVTGSASVTHKKTNGTLIVEFVQTAGLSVVQIPGATFLLADRPTAYQFWAPGIKTAYYESPESHVLVSGPYLVRNATAHGKTLSLIGDINKDIKLEIFANSTFSSITWNGENLDTKKTKYGSRIVNLKGPDLRRLEIPSLNSTRTKWKTIDSLPEIDPKFDDSAWVKADKMNSTNQYFPPKTLPVLYAGEYGYHTVGPLNRTLVRIEIDTHRETLSTAADSMVNLQMEQPLRALLSRYGAGQRSAIQFGSTVPSSATTAEHRTRLATSPGPTHSRMSLSITARTFL